MRTCPCGNAMFAKIDELVIDMKSPDTARPENP